MIKLEGGFLGDLFVLHNQKGKERVGKGDVGMMPKAISLFKDIYGFRILGWHHPLEAKPINMIYKNSKTEGLVIE